MVSKKIRTDEKGRKWQRPLRSTANLNKIVSAVELRGAQIQPGFRVKVCHLYYSNLVSYLFLLLQSNDNVIVMYIMGWYALLPNLVYD